MRRKSPLQFASFAGLPLQMSLGRFNRPGEDTGGGGAAVKEPLTGGGDKDSVSIPRAEYDKLKSSAGQVETLTKETTTLKELRGHMQTVLRSDLDPSKKADSMRSILKDANYTDDQIEAYIDRTLGDSDEEETEEETPRRRSQTGGGAKGKGKQTATIDPAEFEEMKKSHGAMVAELQKVKLDKLNQTLSTATSSVLEDKSSKLGKLFGRLSKDLPELEGEEKTDLEGTISQIKDEFNQAVIAACRTRRDATGRFDESWFNEEAKKVSDQLARKYGPLVIPSASRVGRSGETEEGRDFLLPDKPVEQPVAKRGESLAALELKAQNWATDRLLRSMNSKGGDSRI